MGTQSIRGEDDHTSCGRKRRLDKRGQRRRNNDPSGSATAWRAGERRSSLAWGGLLPSGRQSACYHSMAKIPFPTSGATRRRIIP